MSVVKDISATSIVFSTTISIPTTSDIANEPVAVQGSMVYDVTTKFIYFSDGNSWILLQSSTGPTGFAPPGPPGPTGSPSNVTGPTGEVGPTGSQSNVTGATGPAGQTGSFDGTVNDNAFSIIDSENPSVQLQFSVQGSPDTTTTIATNSLFNRTFNIPDIDGTSLVSQQGTGIVFIGATGPYNNDISGIQYNTVSSSRARISMNQYGNNSGIPGIYCLKSRADDIGQRAPVEDGDVIYRATACAIANDLSLSPSGYISINVPVNGVPSGQGYVASEYELQLTSLNGPNPGIRTVYKITSEGYPQLLESDSSGPHATVPSGLATLGPLGSVSVPNGSLPSNARILLTVQPGFVEPTGNIYVSSIAPSQSFTIKSSAGSADENVIVYYQIYIPLP